MLPRLLVLVFLASCGGSSPTTDAAPGRDAAPIRDSSAPLGDTLPSLSWVDFAVTGCRTQGMLPGPAPDEQDAGRADAGAQASRNAGEIQACVGHAPLSLRFTALAPAAVDAYLWIFGDDTMAEQASPVQVFAEPGIYDVSLTVGGPGGTATASKPGMIVVLAAELGAQCTSDTQCDPDGDTARECICAEGTPCPASLVSGMCAAACDAQAPCALGVCADLGAARPAVPADWQRALCLVECTMDAECPSGLTCQELPAPGGGWVQGCFAPGIVGPMGAPCAAADGSLNHAACASGLCVSMGARGACAAPCVPRACPESSACADFAGSGPSLCLARCTADTNTCTSDPWLACEPARGTGAGAGAWDFTVDEPAAPTGYCAPRTCTAAAECGPDGQCTSGFCGP